MGKLPVLMMTCPKCKGDGVIMNPAWIGWKADMPYPEGPEEMKCRECNGTGKVLTEAGREVAEAVSLFLLLNEGGDIIREWIDKGKG